MSLSKSLARQRSPVQPTWGKWLFALIAIAVVYAAAASAIWPLL